MVIQKQSSPDRADRELIPAADVQEPSRTFPVTVGIGASAGGLETLKLLLSDLPSDCSVAFVVMMHLPENGPSFLADIVGKYTPMRVVTAEDGMPLSPNTVYVPPPGADVTVGNGGLRVHPRDGDGHAHRPIDRLFNSLATDLGERAVAVVLSGFGTDGSEGIKRVREAGGIVLIQDPATAISPPMPQSAIATGLADSVLPIKDIAGKLARIAEGNSAFSAQMAPEVLDEQLRAVFSILQSRTGHDFSAYKKNTIVRRIERRMMVCGARRLGDYLSVLDRDQQEARALCQELLIGVTGFFRDPDAFELLRSKIIPLLFANRNKEEPVRIWHACCATGEEAYSVAILILEFLKNEDLSARVQIFASDLDEEAVAQARAGCYPDDIAAEVGEERLGRFFTRKEGGWQVTKQLREMVVFAHHNLIKDPPFSRLDLLVCRNFLIYLNLNLQKLLIPLFHQVLNPGGYLFLGSAETIGPHGDLFAPVDKKWKIFMRLKGKHKAETLFPYLGSISTNTEKYRAIPSTEDQETATFDQANKILMERYVPARVIINDKNEVIHFSKRAGAYLAPPEGKPTRDILKMAREELRPALRSAIYKAFAQQQEITYRGISTVAESGPAMINIIVLPLVEPPLSGRQALVIIEPVSSAPVQLHSGRGEEPGADASGNFLNRHLEEQLRITSEQLKSTCEQLEASNEKYTLANEELMTVNEELQSTNEELQSTNEELVTVNSELQKKMEELNQSNSDLENLFTSSEVAIVFLDRDLTIKRFSSAMGAILNLAPGDIGRVIQHINVPVDLSSLPADSRQVLEDLTPVKREMSSRDGRSFIMRVLPYRTTEGGVDGVVLKLTDISERKRAEVSLQESEKRFRTMANAIPQLAWIANPDGYLVWYNRRWYDYTGKTPEQMEGWGWQSVHDPAVLPKVLEKWKESISTGEPFDMEFPLLGADGEFRLFLTRVLPLKDAHGKVIQWFGTNTDVTEIRGAEKEIMDAAEQRRLTLEAAELGAWDYNFITGDVFWDRQCRDMWGIREGDSIDYAIAIEQIYPEDRKKVDEAVRMAIAGANGGAYHQEFRVVWPDGSRHWIVSHGRVYSEGEGDRRRPVRFIGVNREATEEKRAEAMQARLAAIVEFSEDAVIAKDPDGNILSWNTGAERIFGYSPQEAVGRPITLLIPPELQEDERKMLRRLLAGDRIPHFETVRLAKDGRRIDVSLTISAIKDLQGRIIGISKIARDITEQKEKEEALRLSEQRRSLALEAAQVGTWEWDLETNENFWSDELWLLYGLEPWSCKPSYEEWRNIVHPDDLQQTERVLQDAVRRGGIYNTEWRVKLAEGGERWLMSRGRPMKDSHGQIGRYMGIVMDVTEHRRVERENKALQEQLTQAQKLDAIGTLAGGVAHDYNNMLNVIIGYTEMAIDELDPNQHIYGELNEVLNAARRSAEITRQLLAFARKQTINPRVLDLNETIAGMLKMLQRLIGENIDLSWNPKSGLWLVKMDTSQVDQILANLCVNARDAIRDVGRITIETDNVVLDEYYCQCHSECSAGDYVMLSVSDTGCGMGKEVIENIFEPFYTTKEVGKGTGMGMSTVYGIVRQNCGSINIYSELGTGSTIKIYIPRHHSEKQTEPAQKTRSIEMGNGETLLLVEDEHSVRKMGTIMLERAGYIVIAAASPSEAIAVAGKHGGTIDLLITDVIMPEMNGKELAGKMQNAYPRIKVLFMSGYTANAIAHHAVLDEGVNFIQKPFSQKDFTGKVRAVLDGVPERS